MSIEKRNSKMKNVLILVLLAVIAVLVLGGMFMLPQDAPMRNDEISKSFNPMQVESAQTGPTGQTVMSTGIVLLLLGFGALVLMVWVGWKKTQHKSS